MILLTIRFEQRGPDMIVAYNAGENETTTPAESKAVETFIGTVQKTIADAGGTGKFVERGLGGNQD